MLPPFLPRVVGHRGAVHKHLENTVEGFAFCGQIGADIELDVFLLKDDTLIVFHGGGDDDSPGTLDEYCGVPIKRILELDYAETQQLKFNTEYEEFPCPKIAIETARIPTLDEVLATMKNYPTSTVKIELKAGGDNLSQRVIELVESLDMASQVCYSSFDHARIDQVKQLRPTFKTGALFCNPIPENFLDNIHDEIHLPYSACTKTIIDLIHRSGKSSMAWFRGPSGMKEDMEVSRFTCESQFYLPVLETGVQQICCNQPNLLLKMMEFM